MPRHNPYRPFTPDPDQMAKWPELSGNTINGLDDDRPRPPRMVYWAVEPDEIPHGQAQLYFYGQSARDPRFSEARAKRQPILDQPLPEVANKQQALSEEGWREALNRFVEDGTCERIGAAAMQADWVFEGHEITLPNVILIGVQHDYDQIRTAPEVEAGLEVMEQYRRAVHAAKRVAAWLRDMGWEAEAMTGPMTGALAMIPAAIGAGFGELGKHGSLINPEHGASFRLSGVVTNAPVPLETPRDHGIDSFCQNCRICEDACPPEALFPEKQTVRGDQKWYVDFDKCLPFFNQTFGCGICIAVCPWSRPGVGVNLAAKLARKKEREGG